VPIIREWLEMRLTFKPDHDFFWVSLKTGATAVPATLYAAMRAETSDPPDFRSPVTPHPLRNAAAIFIVRHAPEKVPLVSPVLGHRDAALHREYIEGAGMIEASRDAARIIMTTGEGSQGRPSPRTQKIQAREARPDAAGVAQFADLGISHDRNSPGPARRAPSRSPRRSRRRRG
jgi:hypothetical protein